MFKWKWRKVSNAPLINGIPEKNSEVIWRSMKGNESLAIVVNMSSGIFYIFKNAEAKIWQLCDGRKTIRQIINKIYEEFPQTRRKDIEKFIKKLVKTGLIHIKSS